MCFFLSELLISKVWHRSHSLIHRSFFYFYYHRKYCTIYTSCGTEGSRQITIKVFFFNYEVCFLFRIVLDAGYFLHTRAFFDNVGTILLYAVVVSKRHFPCLEDFLKGTVHSQKPTSCSKSAAGLLPCCHQANIRMWSHIACSGLLWCKLSTSLLQVDCQDFLSTSLMQIVLTCSKSANIKLQQF